jgi:phage FluMu gp28-like protein
VIAPNPLADLAAPAPGDDLPPAVLLPYQQAWIADEAVLKIAEKGRRVGLTWAEAADDVMIAAREHLPENVMYISATEDMGREYIEACAMWAKAFDYAAGQISEGLYDDGGGRAIKTFEVGFPATGHRIVALSSRPTNLRGKQGTVVIDEAAFHTDLAAMLKAALALLLWGSKVRVISTHNGVENPFAQLIEEVRAGKRGQASVHRIAFRDAVAQGLYRRVCLRRGIAFTQAGEDAWVQQAYSFYGDDAAEELDVVPSSSGGKYLSLALISQRMVPAWSASAPDGPALVRGKWDDGFAYLAEDVRRYAIAGWLREHVEPHLQRLDGDRRHVFGQDFARSSDLSVITVAAELADMSHQVRLVIELANCPFSSQEQILFAVINGLQRRRFRGGAMDATGNGAALAEAAAQRYGTAMIEQVKINAGWYTAHMPKLKAGLQDGTLHGIPRDDALRDDLRAIELVQGVPMVPKVNTASGAARAQAAEGGGKGQKRHGDFAVSLLMAEYAFHREAGEIGFTAAPSKADAWGDADDDFALFDTASGAGMPRRKAAV